MVDTAIAQARRNRRAATVAAGLEQQVRIQRRRRRERQSLLKSSRVCTPRPWPPCNGRRRDARRILLEALPALAAQVDLVLLAQASMARLAPSRLPDLGVPVLTSPQLAVRRLRNLIHHAEA